MDGNEPKVTVTRYCMGCGKNLEGLPYFPLRKGKYIPHKANWCAECYPSALEELTKKLAS